MSGQGTWVVEPEPALRGFAVEWADRDRLVVSRRNRLFVSTGPEAPLTPLASVPAPVSRRLVARLEPAQRLLRFAFYNVVPREDRSYFVTFGRSARILRGGRAQPLGGLLRPTRVLRNACAVDERGDIYFGEYVPNGERGPIHVYRLAAGDDRAEVVHRFEPGEVRHVHGVYHDPYGGGLWCVTGDLPSECRILHTADGFGRVEPVGQGDESWRCISLAFTRDAVYYGSDAEFRTNHLVRLPRRGGGRDVLAEVEGPVYYSATRGDDLFFGVTAELCPSQVEPSAVIWHVSAGSGVRCTRLAAFRKDPLPVRPFLPGTINFAGGPGDPESVYFSGVGLLGTRRRLLRLRRAGHGD